MTFKGHEEVIINSINEGVFTVDKNWHITSFNKAAENITQIAKEDALGKCCSDVFRASICEKACVLRRTMSDGKPVVNATAYVLDHKGRRIPIRISTALLKDDNGKIIGGVETFQDISQIEQLKKEIKEHYTFKDIIGRSHVMKNLFNILPQIAESTSTVLIEGPSGTGKELFARAIHNLSLRNKKPFITVNCAALPDTLLESELFGYKAGAFTDAKKDKPGRFALADQGTIFLDEIGDISPAMQVRLLRVLQDQIIEPLGSVKPIKVDIRIIAATNKKLNKLVHKGTFREDLYYRIRVVHLELPTLNKRREDIPLLIEHLIGKFSLLQGKNITGVSDEVLARLMQYEYPGNIRELENIIEQAFVLCRGEIIELHHLPSELYSLNDQKISSSSVKSLKSIEKLTIIETLRRFHGNRVKTARQLEINQSTLFRKIKSLNIEIPNKDGRGIRK